MIILIFFMLFIFLNPQNAIWIVFIIFPFLFIIAIINMIIFTRRKHQFLRGFAQEQSGVMEEKETFTPYEITCASCGTTILITEDIKIKGIVFCEQCGAQIQIA